MKKRSKKEEVELQKELEKYQHLPRKDRRKTISRIGNILTYIE